MLTLPILKAMKRAGLGIVMTLLLISLGYGAYSLGRSLQAKPELAGTQLETPVDVNEVALVNADGETVALQDYAGKQLLVFFGFTRCPDVCPITLSRVAKIYEDLKEPEAVQVVMITVDPTNDTPELTHQYASAFNANFVGLGGDNSAIAQAAKTFFVGYNDSGDGQIAHTDALFLVDGKGKLQLVYAQDKLSALESDLAQILGS